MSSDQNIYRDIASRTGGNIHIGVVGPVRTGKSTFIRKFMEAVVLPNMSNEYDRRRAMDETPQSADGRTVTTTEPKFIPDEAISVKPDMQTEMKIRLVDCVGYMVPGALGAEEGESPRMVHTPWSDEPLPFRIAAESGTRRVIADHSTIGILVTTDGSFGEIPRENYEEAEARVAAELSAGKKPFAVILNSAHPEKESAVSLAYTLEKKYAAPVALVNCMELSAEDIREIFAMILSEFPMSEIRFRLPMWTEALPKEHKTRVFLTEAVKEVAGRIKKIGDIRTALEFAGENDYIEKWELSSLSAGTGKAEINLSLDDSLFYKTAGEILDIPIENDAELFSCLGELAETRRAYARVRDALAEVEEKGYGIVMPTPDELQLCEPQIVKEAGGYGVKLRASAKSIHMIKADIETEINPIVGSEAQSEELVHYIMSEFKENPAEIWNSNMFGKSIYELVNEGLHTKLAHMPEDARMRLSETLERIINEGSKGLICILL